MTLKAEGQESCSESISEKKREDSRYSGVGSEKPKKSYNLNIVRVASQQT